MCLVVLLSEALCIDIIINQPEMSLSLGKYNFTSTFMSMALAHENEIKKDFIRMMQT